MSTPQSMRDDASHGAQCPKTLAKRSETRRVNNPVLSGTPIAGVVTVVPFPLEPSLLQPGLPSPDVDHFLELYCWRLDALLWSIPNTLRQFPNAQQHAPRYVRNILDHLAGASASVRSVQSSVGFSQLDNPQRRLKIFDILLEQRSVLSDGRNIAIRPPNRDRHTVRPLDASADLQPLNPSEPCKLNSWYSLCERPVPESGVHEKASREQCENVKVM